MIDEDILFDSMFHKVRVIERTSGEPREWTSKVIVYESKYDSGINEACIWLEDCSTILRQSDIMLIQILD